MNSDRRVRTIAVLVLAAGALALGGCAGLRSVSPLKRGGITGLERTSLATDADFRPADVRSVTVMPVLDGRKGAYRQPQAAARARDALVEALRERGYFTLSADGWRETPPPDLDLRVADGESLAGLAPEDADYVLVACVEAIGPGRDREGQTVDATLAAVLVDRAGTRVVWRDVATANSQLSGFLTVLGGPSREYEATANAARALVTTLPDARPPKAK